MPYTPSPNKSEGATTNFGGLVVDANRVAMTGALGNQIQTQDATPITPITSPITLGAGTTTLVVPQNATTITVNPKTAVCRVSEDSTVSVYFTVPVNTSVSFDVARQQNVYLKGTNGDAVDFFFKMV